MNDGQHGNGCLTGEQHWQIPLSRRFRALKLWFVIRNYGVEGLQKHVRHGVQLAAAFEAMVRADGRFEVAAERHLGMVVFRLRGPNDLTERLLKKINSSGQLHCVPAALKGSSSPSPLSSVVLIFAVLLFSAVGRYAGKYVIRFTVTSSHTTLADIERDWRIIGATAGVIIALCPVHTGPAMAGDDQLEEDGDFPFLPKKKSIKTGSGYDVKSIIVALRRKLIRNKQRPMRVWRDGRFPFSFNFFR